MSEKSRRDLMKPLIMKCFNGFYQASICRVRAVTDVPNLVGNPRRFSKGPVPHPKHS